MESKSKLAHPIFVLSVLILIVNDFYLKPTFHNAVTGKLSDFVGLFAFPFFWSIIFPKHSKLIHILTALLFVYWKSEFSQSLIDAINLLGLNTFRTVDSTDHIAMVSILASFYVYNRAYIPRYKPVLIKFFLFVSLFSFVATTQERAALTYEDTFKRINLHNQGEQSITVITNFQYTKAETTNDTSLNNEFNRIDTIKIKAASYDEIITPIHSGDTVNFPSNFKLTVLNQWGKVVKVYDKKTFFKNLDSLYNYQNRDERADEWNLTMGTKPPVDFKPWTIYGRWKTIPSSKKTHTFEIRKGHYYDVDPDSDIAKYTIQDSTLTVRYKTTNSKGRILKVTADSLMIKWEDRGLLWYKKLYN